MIGEEKENIVHEINGEKFILFIVPAIDKRDAIRIQKAVNQVNGLIISSKPAYVQISALAMIFSSKSYLETKILVPERRIYEFQALIQII